MPALKKHDYLVPTLLPRETLPDSVIGSVLGLLPTSCHYEHPMSMERMGQRGLEMKDPFLQVTVTSSSLQLLLGSVRCPLLTNYDRKAHKREKANKMDCGLGK